MQKIIIEKIKKNYSRQKEVIITNVLKNYFHITDFNICYTENGKPYIKDNLVYFSISNDEKLLLIAFSDKPIGADLQFFRAINESTKKFLNMSDLSDKDVIINFSAKEAILKLEGKKLSDIININTSCYRVQTFIKKKYVINIASFNE